MLNLRKFKLLVMLFVLVAGLTGAFAANADSNGSPSTPVSSKVRGVDNSKKSWDLYVYGNGEVVVQVFYGVKMLMVPDIGTSSFPKLMMVISVLGFIILAIMAGFDPARNLMRMFGYIFVVWVISYLSTKMTTNVTVVDVVDSSQTETVANVPALVVLPAAITSQVGQYFTKTFETYFTTPTSFKMSEGVGQFNLFSKMVEESSQYGFRSAELKKSFSAYVADCMVPALALGNVSEVRPGTGGEPGVTVTGIAALTSSSNLLETFKTGKHKAIMTTYFPEGTATGIAATMGGMGTVVSCEKSYELLSADVKSSATALIGKGSEAWTKAGIMVPFETAFSQMLAEAARGASTSSNYSSPNGFIMQQGFLNSMSGAFRTAALQTGNNELMQAAALSQAETMQKSAWVTSFSVFNNMMGYVFSVLQAFIYAIAPIMIIAMLVPGIGKGIFMNYAQILIWLMLWMPMLAIINFIITLFAADSAAAIIGTSGLTQENRGIFVERNKNLVIAAQFLGTMVPMLSWGIVKGAMAFTEFISSGVGSQFASQAGQAAATGNLSMNNMQLNNASMNKYNTAQGSNVGFQSVNAFSGAGSMNMAHEGGGQTTSMHGQNISAQQQLQTGLSSMIQESQSLKDTMSQIQAKASTYADAKSFIDSSGFTGNRAEAHAIVDQLNKSTNDTTTDKDSMSASAAAQMTDTGGQEKTEGVQSDASLNTSLGVNFGGTGASARNSNAVNSAVRDSEGTMNTLNESGQVVKGYDESTSSVDGAGQTKSGTATESQTESHSQSNTNSITSTNSFSDTLSNAIAREQSFQESVSAMQSLTETFGVPQGMSMHQVNDLLSEMESIRNTMGSADEIRGQMRDLALNANLGDIDNYPTGGFRGQAGGPSTGGGVPTASRENLTVGGGASRSMNELSSQVQNSLETANAHQDQVFNSLDATVNSSFENVNHAIESKGIGEKPMDNVVEVIQKNNNQLMPTKVD